jgi:3-oxoacyl-[acyl-carrier-protein] synthase-3
VLVVGVETLSRIVDYTDRNTCVLFGDGAGAAVSARVRAGRHARGGMHSDGELRRGAGVPAGISRNPASDETVARTSTSSACRARSSSVRRAQHGGIDARCAELAAGRLRRSTCIPHQANLRIIERGAERLGMPRDKVYVNIDRYGNTSSARIRSRSTSACARRLKPGDKLGVRRVRRRRDLGRPRR